jgi:hypothetical protein
MFEDASNSAASEREIQSDGGFDIGQSGSFVGVAAESAVSDFGSVPPLLDDESPLDPPVDPEPESESDELRLGFAPLLPDRSLRAQPLPLKWTAGATIAFFIGPPQTGQTVGPWSCTECMTSTSWPQLAQT